MSEIRRKIEDEKGEIMLEATFIIVSVLVLMMVLLSMTFLFYQKSMMSSVSAEIAADIAKNYKFTDHGTNVRNYTIDEITSEEMFRMTFQKKKVFDAQNKRAQEYADWRLPLATLGIHSGNIEVDCSINQSGIGRAYVEVTVSQKAEFFLSGVLEMTGIAKKNTLFSSTSYAECADYTEYTSLTNFTKYVSEQFGALNTVGDLYSSIKKFAGEIAD